MNWSNPNDRAQAQWLPWIGEKCLFSHGGKTYYGHHTGSCFKTGRGCTANYFLTNTCLWMYLPQVEPAQQEISE